MSFSPGVACCGQVLATDLGVHSDIVGAWDQKKKDLNLEDNAHRSLAAQTLSLPAQPRAQCALVSKCCVQDVSNEIGHQSCRHRTPR